MKLRPPRGRCRKELHRQPSHPLAAAEKSLPAKKGEDRRRKTAYEAAKKPPTSADRVESGSRLRENRQKAFERAKGEFDGIDKVPSRPCPTKGGELDTQIARAAEDPWLTKQADPAAARKGFAAKAQPVQAAMPHKDGAGGTLR